MDTTYFEKVKDYNEFKDKLIEFNNWRMNIMDEWEEEFDDKCINFIRKNYSVLLKRILTEETDGQLKSLAYFMYYLYL